MLQGLHRLKVWALDQIDVHSPSLGAMGMRPTLDWVLSGRQADAIDTAMPASRDYWRGRAEHAELLVQEWRGRAEHAKRVAHEEMERAHDARDETKNVREFYTRLLTLNRGIISDIHRYLVGRCQLNWNNACKHDDQFVAYGARERAAAYRLAANGLRDIVRASTTEPWLPECSEDGNQYRGPETLRIPNDMCPHGCGHKFMAMWDWDWSKGEVITECPACRKPVDLKVRYYAHKGEPAAQEATRKAEITTYPDRVGGHRGKRGDVVVGSALNTRAMRRPGPR